ncbi:ABC transporter ATP-binding protein [Thalassovita sp.]|uniref:ABC transporter ATP-binding protein n=1 Tax=Thalassovita sp. TaxID=1979401 RepID=UPI002880D2A6|nr:ABC transporter ATP-binding protein [Thalassovita sp.]MDF1804433.1 ABC transporter ATP-binding protein [Thalassovita sp.]
MSLLEVSNIEAFYGDFKALYGVDLSLEQGECLGLVGSNGAGKSTLMRVIAGAHEGRVAGTVAFDGAPLPQGQPHLVVSRGVVLIPEGRKLFRSLSVQENLQLAAEVGRKGHWTLERVYDLFPILRDFADRPSTALSGGQQQMVAIGRGLLSNPSLLLCDELSLGLAPIIIKDIYESLKEVARQGTSLLVVEQDVEAAKRVSDHLVCMRSGRVVLTGTPDSLSPEDITAAYFGMETT